MNIAWLTEASSLEPTTYVHYLRSRGWQRVEVDARFPFTRFRRQVGDQTAEIDVPAQSDLGDYRRRIREVVEVLMAVERISWPELYVRLCSPSADEFRLRLIGGDLAGGRIGLDDAIRLRVARKQLLLAAAHSVVDPRPHFPRLGFAEPLAFLTQCRELPSTPGSWISSIQIPIEPALAEESRVPYSRKVTEMLAQGLSIVANALGKDGEERLLHSAAQGVSSNFLSALAQLHPVAETGLLELDFTWSQTRPSPRLVWQTTRFGAESFAVFESASKWLREHTTPTEDFGLEGYVISLTRDDHGAGTSQDANAEIVVLTETEEHKQIRVHVHVPAEDHEVALRAYREGGRVGIRGTLAREGRTWRLMRPGPIRSLATVQGDSSDL
ncbi:MAG: hypothetical protein R6X02_15750 [Enhygromyxa sp.]